MGVKEEHILQFKYLVYGVNDLIKRKYESALDILTKASLVLEEEGRLWSASQSR